MNKYLPVDIENKKKKIEYFPIFLQENSFRSTTDIVASIALCKSQCIQWNRLIIANISCSVCATLCGFLSGSIDFMLIILIWKNCLRSMTLFHFQSDQFKATFLFTIIQ